MQRGGAEATVESLQDASGVPIVKVTGEVDMSNVDVVRAAVDLAIADDPDRIVFDLGMVEVSLGVPQVGHFPGRTG